MHLKHTNRQSVQSVDGSLRRCGGGAIRLVATLLAMVGSLMEPALWSPAVAEETRAEERAFRVVGYLPEYRAEAFDPSVAKPLTDLILFSAEPTAAGDLDLSRLQNIPWEKLREYKTRERVRLILCVGGWERSRNFAAASASRKSRQAFAAAAVRVCLMERLDGLDLDWEHPKNEAEQEGYADLLAELKAAFRPHGLVLSVTLAAWQKLPRRAFALVDSVNVMAYDHPGRHSTFDKSLEDVAGLIAAGAPPEKLVLGMPFYGRDVKSPENSLTYREIREKFNPASDVDEVEGIYFNGPATIRRKTRHALDAGLGGVMVWELGQDAPGDAALLNVIRETIERRGATRP